MIQWTGPKKLDPHRRELHNVEQLVTVADAQHKVQQWLDKHGPVVLALVTYVLGVWTAGGICG